MERRKNSLRRQRRELTVDTALGESVSMGVPTLTRATTENLASTSFLDDFGASDECVEYGMIISLLSMDRNGILAAEGYSSLDVRLEHLVANAKHNMKTRSGQLVSCQFKECLFEIVPKMSYESISGFDEAQTLCKGSSAVFSTVFNEMKFKSESEQRLNATTYEKLLGKRITYGQTIQLRHIKSGKFLCIHERSSSTPDSADILLDKASPDAYFVILPRFKLRKSGQPILLTDQFLLIHETLQLYLQTSSRLSTSSLSTALITSKVHPSPWRALLYEKKEANSNNVSTLKAGQCLRFLHLETNAWLGYYNDNGSQLQVQSHQNSEVLECSNMVAPESLWEVERAFTAEGGVVKWSDTVAMRHVISGKYIAMDSTTATIKMSDELHPLALHATISADSRSAIPQSSVVLLQHASSKRYFHPNGLATTSNLPSIHDHFVADICALPAAHDEDAFQIFHVSEVDTNDTLLLLSIRNTLQKFVGYFQQPSRSSISSSYSGSAVVELLYQVEDALNSLNNFAFESGDVSRRQLLLRHHHYIELLTTILKAPFDSYGGPYTINYVCSFNYASHKLYDRLQSNVSPTLDGLEDDEEYGEIDEVNRQMKVTLNLPPMFQLSEAGMQTLNRIISTVNLVLYRIFCHSKITDDVSACREAMPVLMELLGHGFKASIPLSCLIQEKWHISDFNTSYTKTLRSFLDLIKTRGKSIRYLQFLAVLCSANGHAISKVQEKLCDLLFDESNGYTRSILIPTRPTDHGLEIYIPVRKDDEGRWTSLNDFYDEYYKSKMHSTLAPYYYGLIQLYCALCMDRNYSCINKLQDMFPRSSLINTIQDIGLSRSVRAALLNLLLVLHIDCEPQKAVASPNYTRIWNRVNLDIPSCTSVDPFITQLKDILISYLKRHKGVLVVAEYPQNELTLAVVRTIEKLVSFGMFSFELKSFRTDLIENHQPQPSNKPEYVIPFFENSVQRHKHPYYRQYSTDAQEIQPMLSDSSSFNMQKSPKAPDRQMSLKSNSTSASARLPDTKYRASEWNNVVMEIKNCVCTILLRVDSFRLDYQISNVLWTLQENWKKPRSPSWSRMKLSPLVQAMQNKSLECIYSLPVLAKRRVDTILLQALMYEHPPLVSKALELYIQQFNQHDQVFKALDNILLLVHEDSVQVYAQLQEKIDIIRQLAETTEIWMDLTSQNDIDTAEKACSTLFSLISLMKMQDNEVEISRILHNALAIDHIMTIICAGRNAFRSFFPAKVTPVKSQSPSQKSTANISKDLQEEKQRDIMNTLYTTSMKFLSLVFQNLDDIHNVEENAKVIIEFVENLPDAQEALFNLYRNNSANIPMEFLGMFINLAACYKSIGTSRYLDFLCGIAVNPRVQKAVLVQMIKYQALFNFKASGLPKYQASILNLLAQCASSPQPELKDLCAKSFVPLDVWTVILETSVASLEWSLAIACLRYFNEVFIPLNDSLECIDCKVQKDILKLGMRLDLLALQQVDLQLVVPSGSRHTLDALIHVVFPTLESYLPKIMGTDLISNDISEWEEWLSAWYVWLFGTWIASEKSNDEISYGLSHCIHYVDIIWQQDVLGELWDDIYLRQHRPSLSVGLAGLRGNEPFVLDLDNSTFIQLLPEIKSYQTYLNKLPKSNPEQRNPSFRLTQPQKFQDIIAATDAVGDKRLCPKELKHSLMDKAVYKKNEHFSPPKLTMNLPHQPLARVSDISQQKNSPDKKSIVSNFLNYARDHHATKLAMRNELTQMMQNILSIQTNLREEHYQNTTILNISLTFDDIVSKLISHFEMLKIPQYSKMSITLLEVLVQMITSLESSEKRHSMQLTLNSLGATELVINLISSCDDLSLVDKAIALGVALLDGMNARVQENFYTIWTQTKNTTFFERLYNNLASTISHDTPLAMQKLVLSTKVSLESTGDVPMRFLTITRQLRFQQLLCEGHYLDAQKYFLSQKTSSYNLVDMTIQFLMHIYSNVTFKTIAVLKQVFDTIAEYCQGPCWEAQSTVASYRFVTAVNHLLSCSNEPSFHPSDPSQSPLRELKSSIVIAVLSLLEGRSDRQIHYRLVQELNFDAIKDNVVEVFKYFEQKYNGWYDGNEMCSKDSYLTLGFNLHILMQQLIEFQPSLVESLYPRKKLRKRESSREIWYQKAFNFFNERCARVEVVWHQHCESSSDLIAIYFPIHPICCCVTAATKRQLLLDVSRESNKLYEFFIKTHLVMQEMEHQCLLRQNHLKAVLSKNASQIKMATFTWSLLLNVVVLTNYNMVSLWYPMGCIQVLLCGLLLFMFWTNEVPLVLTRYATQHTYMSHKVIQNNTMERLPRFDANDTESLHDVEMQVRYVGENTPRAHLSHSEKILAIFTNGRLIYRTLIFIAAVAGITIEPFYFSIHLVDFINRSQELRDVLKAIVYPGKTLLHIVLFYLLVVYVFATFAYTYFPGDFKVDATTNGCETLWQCFLTSLDEGLKNNGGVGAYLSLRKRGVDPLGYVRLVFDLAYDIILIIILLNITFGVIIDTFASLRTTHKEQLDDIRERCFICSIDGYTFNRMTKRGFEYHTHMEHNVWHYIYLFVHIRKKSYTEFNGVELYLAMQMARNDVSFFPNHRALTLEKLERSKFDTKENKVSSRDTEAWERMDAQLSALSKSQSLLQTKQDALSDQLQALIHSISKNAEHKAQGKIVLQNALLYLHKVSLDNVTFRYFSFRAKTMSYVGDIKDRLRHGEGTYTFPGGYYKYSGTWDHGKMHGHGIFFMGDGGTYEGNFVNGEMDGAGIRRWSNGTTYSGEFFRGEMHGQGSYVAMCGKRYEGGWKDNQYSGHGELHLVDGSMYIGDFERNKFHGEGKMIFYDGSTYDGFWSEGLKDGLGTYIGSNGTSYEGSWVNGKRSGKGRGVFENGAIYQGFWKDDKPENQPYSLLITRLGNDNTTPESTPLVFKEFDTTKPLESSTPEEGGEALPLRDYMRLAAFRIECLNMPPNSKSNKQQGTCVVEESGRLLRIRLMEGKIPGSIVEVATEVQKGKKLVPTATSPDILSDTPPVQLELFNQENEAINELLITTDCGVGFIPSDYALPQGIGTGEYFLLVESALDTSIPPAYYPLSITKGDDMNDKSKLVTKKK
ncbi:ryanodine-inositol 1,4,5-triphosphate receptor Ca2 channel (RIR-CaC) family protein [Thraustotheca clavata]|uniref:Ryanodine-inositol 1,4,5-triphosphate receptor Ca2 channel (RIR-CaC) family protein n=1 Tax=Thraustotheca clavata TaxID=74557 RepID=A0A1W0AAR6_9STRA|nr:ryanodine-inositol 1,4,5-triphosphate receptor Ca2 channel (RIR-CaC) family protein [Thraustotheca clavata]